MPSHQISRKPRRVSIHAALLLAVNTVLLVGVVSLLIIDYQRGLDQRLRTKQTNLVEEASLVLPAVAALRHHGNQAVQDYIDRACAQMQDSLSPGHHIAVQVGEEVFQARTHGRASDDYVKAMRQAETRSDHQATVDGRSILVGVGVNNDTRVYVSEFTTNVRRVANAELRSRAIGIALVGFALTGIVNIILIRLVSRPIERLVQAVRRIGKGHFLESRPHFATREFDFLASELGEMSQSLAVVERNRQLVMNRAREIQINLLPKPELLESLKIHHEYLPADDVGGDFLDVKLLDEHRAVVCLGDVTGHGVPAAMGAAMLKTLFQNSSAKSDEPAAVLSEINQRFHAVTLDGDFATMFMGVLDRRAGHLKYASAGHEIGFIIRENREIKDLNSTGLILGVDPDSTCELRQIDVIPGDTIVLLTDGLTETMSPEGKLLGRIAVAEDLMAAFGATLPELTARLIQHAAEYRGDGPQLDDITLVAVRV